MTWGNIGVSGVSDGQTCENGTAETGACDASLGLDPRSDISGKGPAVHRMHAAPARARLPIQQTRQGDLW